MKVGIIDSGIGGISTLKAIMERVGADYYYYMDNANVPYGDKSRERLIAIASDIVDTFVNEGVSIIVIACNTLSAVASTYIRAHANVPVVCIEPSIKSAYVEGGRTIVIATTNTIASPKFIHMMTRYESNIAVASSHSLASLIENGDMSGATREVDRLLSLGDFDNVVLGCTHYVFLKSYIEARGYKVFEGNDGVSRRVVSLVGCGGSGSRVFMHSTAPIHNIDRISSYLGLDIQPWR